jgi:uncharacterized protein YqfA (UPF0365 family)
MNIPFSFPLLLLAIAFLALFFFLVPVKLWFEARFNGVKISLLNLVVMRIRAIPPKLMADNLIMSYQAGVPLAASQLESHFKAGGNVTDVTHAIVAAKKANISLPFETATAIDLAGRQVYEAVKMSVKPKVIETPRISAVAKDGIQVTAIAKVTVRTNIARLVGGATEETIIARVGEGVVTTIGSASTHKDVLENPDSISRTVLQKGLDSGTAYEILSIDIADVDVGNNIGAVLQTDQAEADKKIAQAKAEERKAMAIAREQEMRAAREEMRAKVVEAEREVPLAIAEALRSGNLGVMDYYRLRNIQADTGMRESLGSEDNSYQQDQDS